VFQHLLNCFGAHRLRQLRVQVLPPQHLGLPKAHSEYLLEGVILFFLL
jgi:hypothetical protein